MKSMYKQQLMMMVSIVVLSFVLLSAAFMILSYRYIIADKRDSMESNARYISNFATNYGRVGSLEDDYFRNYAASIALISDSYVVICDIKGDILYATDGASFYELENAEVPRDLIQQVMLKGSYTGMSDLGGLHPEQRYLAALPYSVTFMGRDLVQGIVLVSADTTTLSEMWRATATIFFFTAVVVLLISVVACSISSAHQAKPLKEMADTARRFGRGDFEAQLSGYEGREDEIGELAEAFMSMSASLAKVEQHRAEFIANVSHELKTPMTTIAGFAEGILDGTVPPERQRESLQLVVSETRRLSRLVRKMLDVSQLNAMAEHVNAQEQFDFTETMSQVLISLESKITGRNLDVDINMPDSALMVWGDPDGITQVCYNLLDNAAKFAASGTSISIDMTKRDGKLYTTIENLGATIPRDELPLLFDRFHKADYSRSIDREGVGLGLHIVKTILGNLNETIIVTSEEGTTKFVFTLTLV